MGRALLDAVRDAANRWVFPERGDAWDGVRFAAFNATPQPTHFVDVSDTFDAGVRSLQCHATYLRHLGGEMAEPESFLRSGAETAGEQAGVALATTFEVIG